MQEVYGRRSPVMRGPGERHEPRTDLRENVHRMQVLLRFNSGIASVSKGLRSIHGLLQALLPEEAHEYCVKLC